MSRRSTVGRQDREIGLAGVAQKWCRSLVLRTRSVRPQTAPWGQRPANNVRVVACRVVEMLTVEIEGCRASHARLAARIEGLTDEVVREPSLLPAWSVGHVLTHLARNAEAMFHRIEATTRGEVIDQYVGGAEGRASEIESGAGRPANVLINDVISWSQRLDATFVSLPDDSWNRPVRSGRGDEHPVSATPVSSLVGSRGPSRRPCNRPHSGRLATGTG